ncbi:MAG TPA: arginase family protein [Micavibrio sp.]|nr:arginase family protein [Micavibrio sp.]
MILFFPQYQAGYMPSAIPVGTPALRSLWKNDPGFVEVPVEETDASRPKTERGVRFSAVIRRQLQKAAEAIDAKKPDFILTTGGDCGGSFPSIAYMNEKYDGRIGVIWVDAHADIHTPSTSPSGNYHGMVLRHLAGDEEFDIKPALPLRFDQIAYLGLRDTEKEEDAVIGENGIPRFSAAEIMKSDAPMDAVIAHFKKHGITHLYLHVDCDVMDEKIFPHVHVPEPDGLTLNRLLELLQYLRSRMPVAGCCLTEYAPQTPGAGIDVVKRVYTEGLGWKLPE